MVNFTSGTRVHFVGIGGVSMSALAELLHRQGCRISGSDRQASALTAHLESLGIPVQIGHTAEAVGPVDCVIYTSATDPNNPERRAATERGIPLIRRAELLGQLTATHPTICVAGTHGKTTTTGMVTAVLEAGGLDPTALVGGTLQDLNNNLRIGNGPYWVVEADEYDRSFLALKPAIAVVTTLEADHLDCYKDFDDIRATFAQFVNALPDEGCAVLSTDDPNVQTLNLHDRFQHMTYGISNAQIRADNITQDGFGTRFIVYNNTQLLGEITLQIPGRHNVQNALAAVAIGWRLNIAWPAIQQGLGAFRGIHRRFDILGVAQNITVVDDYAHHPTEIRATLQAARATWKGRIVAAFQPHLYSRTRDFADDFARALAQADRVWLTDVYPAREEPIPGINGALIAGKIPGAQCAPTLEKLQAALIDDLRPGDLLLVMGAGDIERVAHGILKHLQNANGQSP